MGQRSLARATHAFKKGDWQTAVKIYETIYRVQPSIRINHLLACSLLKLGNKEYALEMVLQALDSYLVDERHFRFLITVIIKNEQLLMANQIATTIKDLGMKKETKQKISIAELNRRHRTGFNDDCQKFYQLSTKSIYGQRQRYEEGKHLPLKEWIMATKKLLVDPYTKPIIRVTLLQDLQKIRFDEPLNFQWLEGKPREIVPSKLIDFEKHPTVNMVQSLLLETLSQQKINPELSMVIMENEMVNLTLLYPFIDDVIISPEMWITSTIKHLGDPHLESLYYLNYEDDTIMLWRKKLATLTKAMQN